MNFIKSDYKDFIMSMNHYDVVIIDPPWNFNDKHPSTKNQLSYNLWDDNIECLKFVFENIKCDYLFLWTCNSLLMDVFKSSTNFDYKTCVTWRKLTTKGNDFYGLGSTFRNSTEQLLVFQKPSTKCLKLSLRTIINEECGKRTCKPKNFEYNLFEKLIGKNMKICYIFSGIYLEKFKNLEIDCVDCVDF